MIWVAYNVEVFCSLDFSHSYTCLERLVDSVYTQSRTRLETHYPSFENGRRKTVEQIILQVLDAFLHLYECVWSISTKIKQSIDRLSWEVQWNPVLFFFFQIVVIAYASCSMD